MYDFCALAEGFVVLTVLQAKLRMADSFRKSY